jgi:CRISPR-associated protein Cas1
MRQPPTTLANALLSFLNTLLYTHCLSELYHTPLHPGISFLHEPRHRRFSLALDLSEPFRPLLTDRLLFRLLNRQEITEADLEPLGNLPGVFLKESARKSVVRAFADLMSTTIQHRRLKRSVSYRTLLRLEAYKLMRHLLQIESYRALRAWW